MNIQFMWKDRGSGAGDCHAIYKTDDGYILVGDILDHVTIAAVHAEGSTNSSGIGSAETAVFVKANVIDRLRETA